MSTDPYQEYRGVFKATDIAQPAKPYWIVLFGIALFLISYYPLRYYPVIAFDKGFQPLLETVYMFIAALILLFIHYRIDFEVWCPYNKMVSFMAVMVILLLLLDFGFKEYRNALNMLYLVPLVEELFFRGLVLNYFRRHYGWGLGILFTTALFVIMRTGLDWPAMASLIILSVILCGLMKLRGGLIYAVVVHVIWNYFVAYNGYDITLDGWTSHISLMLVISAIAVAFVQLTKPRSITSPA